MTTSRLKFELIDGCESNGVAGMLDRQPVKSPSRTQSPLNGFLNSDMTTPQFANNGHYSEALEWSRRPDTLRSNAAPFALDPGLFRDLAEGLEFLNNQLDDSQSELERSRQQSAAFEHDARRWEQEAARLRQEADETRGSIRQLRQEFEQSRQATRQQQEIIERLVQEMGQMRAARADLETLAAEQQRALILSMEMLKRVNVDVAPMQKTPSAEPEDVWRVKDSEIAELKRLVHSADEEGTRTNAELAAAYLEIASRRDDWDSAQAEILSLRTELEGVRAELAATQAAFGAAHGELKIAYSDLESARGELNALEKQAKNIDAPDPILVEPPQLKELQKEQARIAQLLLYAEAEVALQSSEVDSRGAIIVALENALEEQNSSLRTLEERFLSYAEQVQSLQLERLEMPVNAVQGITSKFASIFSPPKRKKAT